MLVMKDPKPAPAWLIACVTSDPLSPANSIRRTVTRAAVLLSVLVLPATQPASLGDTSLAHIVLAATALVPLAAAALAVHRLADGRIESVTRRLLLSRVKSGLWKAEPIRGHAANLFLRDESIHREDENQIFRRLWTMLLALGLPACIVWVVLSRLVGGVGLVDLTVSDALALSLAWPIFIPVAGVLAVLIEANVQTMGCPLAGGGCAQRFGHDGECQVRCWHRNEGMVLLRLTLGNRCSRPEGHDGDHLYLCGRRLDRTRFFKRANLPCALPDGHDDACRSMCSAPMCWGVDGHEGEHSLIRGSTP